MGLINKKTNRIYGLDILRAMAIIFVIIGHGNLLLPDGIPIKKLTSVINLDGVAIFFVLSGYLIGRIILRELIDRTVSFGALFNFWLRRWLRTLPNYYFVLLLLTFILPFLFYGQIEDSLLTKSKFIFFLQNVYQKHPYFFAEAWSLSIEEWFYFIVPLLLLILIRILRLNPRKIVILTSLTILGVVTYYRIIKFEEFDLINNKIWDNHFRKTVVTRLDSIIYGVLGAIISTYYPKFWAKKNGLFLILGVLLLFFERHVALVFPDTGYGFFKSVFSFSVASLGTLLTLPYLSNLKAGKGFIYTTITIISVLSYSMYLIHLSVVQGYLLNIFPSNIEEYTSLRYLTYLLFTLIGSVIMYKYIEIPFMKLREKVT